VPLQIGAILALGSISYKFVEVPFRMGSWGGKSPKLLGFVGSSLSSILISVIGLNPFF